MDPAVYGMMKCMLAEQAAAQASASAKKVKSEPVSKAAGSPPLCGKKRSLEETNDKECRPPLVLNKVCSPPPGFSRKPQHLPSRHDGDGTDWVATREQLKQAKSELAAAGAEVAKAIAGLTVAEAEVVKAKAELTAAKRAADATAEEKPGTQLAMEEAEVAKATAKLAVAKRALEEQVESAKAAAVQQLLCCEEQVRRRAEHALQRYQRWRTGRAPAGRAA
jgi:hypothetical protein